MNRIDAQFRKLKSQGKKGLIAYITGGYPNLAHTDTFAHDLEKAGVDILEIGVPFSDPIADGPTIQLASQKALEGGITLRKILAWVARFRRTSQLPIVLMSYLNPIHRMTFRRFAREASAAGVDGLIVPDLIPEESGQLKRDLRLENLHLIFLVAPTTPLRRIRQVARASSGFLYAVSLTGVTGTRRRLAPNIFRFLKTVRDASPVPVALGFGISSESHARLLGPHADAIIVGSAFIELIRQKKSPAGLAAALRHSLDLSSGR